MSVYSGAKLAPFVEDAAFRRACVDRAREYVQRNRARRERQRYNRTVAALIVLGFALYGGLLYSVGQLIGWLLNH